MTEKGYTLLEMLVVMSMITSCFILVLPLSSSIDLSEHEFLNDYYRSWTYSQNEREDVQTESIYAFNSNGHINTAGSISQNGHTIIIHLGNGYLTYE